MELKIDRKHLADQAKPYRINAQLMPTPEEAQLIAQFGMTSLLLGEGVALECVSPLDARTAIQTIYANARKFREDFAQAYEEHLSFVKGGTEQHLVGSLGAEKFRAPGDQTF